MSDNIPFELVAEIINRLPAESLLRFRCVSKSCKSLIDSSHFINHYTSQKQHLLVRSSDLHLNYVSIVDDDTFPQHTVTLTPPPLVKKLNHATIVGSSEGLLCLYNYYLYLVNMAVIWNPSIRKQVAVMVPNMTNDKIYKTELGFAVCPVNNDPKIVKITCVRSTMPLEPVSCIPFQVEVFALSTGEWRNPYSSVFPRKSIMLYESKVVIDGAIYQLGIDGESESSHRNLIISFDITSEEFREVNLSDALPRDHEHSLSIGKLRNSLVVLDSGRSEMGYDVWMMDDGVSKSFTKMFTICSPDVKAIYVLEFRKSGEPVIQFRHAQGPHGLSLAVYEPDSKRINKIEIQGKGPFDVNAYMETLLLLDQPDSIVYGNTTPPVLEA